MSSDSECLGCNARQNLALVRLRGPLSIVVEKTMNQSESKLFHEQTMRMLAEWMDASRLNQAKVIDYVMVKKEWVGG